MDTKAIWQYEPIMGTWNLYLTQRGGSTGSMIAVRRADGNIDFQPIEPYTTPEVPPLLRIPDWILQDVILPAAPGAPNAKQQAGRVEALEEALKVERERIDKVLDRSLPVFESDGE